MDNKHGDKLSWGAEDSFSSRCFGDLCGVLGCGEYAFETGCFAAGVGSRGEGKKGCESCDSGEMDRRRHRCKALFHRYVVVGIGFGGMGAGVGRIRTRRVPSVSHAYAS